MTANGQGVFLWEGMHVRELGVVMVAQLCECTKHRSTVCFQMVKMVLFMLRVFCHETKTAKVKTSSPWHKNRKARAAGDRKEVEGGAGDGGGLLGGCGGLGRGLRLTPAPWEATGRFEQESHVMAFTAWEVPVAVVWAT